MDFVVETEKVFQFIQSQTKNFTEQNSFDKGYYQSELRPRCVLDDGNLYNIKLSESSRRDFEALIEEKQFNYNIWIPNEVIKHLKLKKKSKEKCFISSNDVCVFYGESYWQILPSKTKRLHFYNIDQFENGEILNLAKKRTYNKEERIKRIEEFILKLTDEFEFFHSNQPEVYYETNQKNLLEVYFPSFEQFKKARFYYQTILHEIGHALLRNELNFSYTLDDDYFKNTVSVEYHDKHCLEETSVDLASNFFVNYLNGESIEQSESREGLKYVSHWFYQLLMGRHEVSNLSSNELLEYAQLQYFEKVIPLTKVLYEIFIKMDNKDGKYKHGEYREFAKSLYDSSF